VGGTSVGTVPDAVAGTDGPAASVTAVPFCLLGLGMARGSESTAGLTSPFETPLAQPSVSFGARGRGTGSSWPCLVSAMVAWGGGKRGLCRMVSCYQRMSASWTTSAAFPTVLSFELQPTNLSAARLWRRLNAKARCSDLRRDVAQEDGRRAADAKPLA